MINSLTELQVSNGTVPVESFRVNLKKRKILLHTNVYRFIDKDTRQIVIYVPSLDISGYGESFEKAKEMLNFSLQEFFIFLVKLHPERIQAELIKLGWKKGNFNKQYSKVYKDSEGQLQNFNADSNTIEHLTLTAA